jgi:outer membrane protein assembly factor BamB
VRDEGARATVAWSWASPADIEVSAGVAPDGTVVVGPNNEWAYGLSPAGQQRWQWRKGDWSYSSAAVTPDGRAWFGDHLGFLDVLNASTGTELRRLGTIPKSEPHPDGVGVWTAPAVDGRGDVYFGTVVGHVYGFNANGGRLFDLPTAGQVDSYPALDASGTLYIGSTDGVLYAIGR